MTAEHHDRSLGGTEKLFWHNDRAGGFRVVAWTEIEGVLDRADLERGMAGLRARHPVLRARIVREGVHKLWFRSGAPPIPLVDDETHELDAALEDEIATPLPDEGPLVRIRWVHRARALVATLHHSAGEGMTASILLRDLLRYAQGEAEALPMPSAVEDWFPAETRGLGGMRRMGAALGKIGAAGRPVRLSADGDGPRQFGLLRRALPQGQIARVAERAKSAGGTIFDALCAASLLAARADLGADAPVVMTCGCPVNLRERLGTNSSDSAGLVIASLPITLTVRPDASLASLVAEISAIRKVAIDEGHHFALSRFLALQAALTDWVSLGRSGAERAARFIESAGVPTLAISNLGRLPLSAAEGGQTLRTAGFAAGLGATADLTLFSATLGAHSTLTFVHAMPRIGRERAARFASATIAQLLGETE